MQAPSEPEKEASGRRRKPTLEATQRMTEHLKFKLNVYPKISKNLGIATHTECFDTREAAEARQREIETQDTEHRLHLEITEALPRE